MRFLSYLMACLVGILPAKFVHANDFVKNEEVRQGMRREGDDGRTPRAIQHYAYFPDEVARKTYREFVTSRGYEIDDEHGEGSGRNSLAIIFSKVQAPTEIDDETKVLDDNAVRLSGVYDGWETAIVRP